MSKAEDEIISILSETDWLSLPQIIEAARFKKATTKVTVCRLVNKEVILKKECLDGSLLYKKARKSFGFGISRNLSDLDQLLRSVRSA